jgi:DNA-binding response OmpR family regulator
VGIAPSTLAEDDCQLQAILEEALTESGFREHILPSAEEAAAALA